MKRMRLFAFIALVFSVLAFASCSSDDKEDDMDLSVESLIVGKWKAESGDGREVVYYTFGSEGSCEIRWHYTYSDGTTDGENAVGFYILDGNELSIRVRWDDSNDYEEEGGTIELITKTRLVIKDEYGDLTVLTRV